MNRREDEIEDFKTLIDLVSFAEAEGYEIDERRSSRRSVALKSPARNDKIIVSCGSNRHFIYTSVHDRTDSGTIIDFCQNRGGGSLGEVRKRLRPWLDGGAAAFPRPRASKRPPLEPVVVDLEAVQMAFDATAIVDDENAYLTGQRGIPAKIYGHRKFRGRVRTDERGNIIFSHVDAGGSLAGFEIKNAGFTGFAKGGTKRLMGSGIAPDDTRLVIAESGVDVLSYASLFGVDDARFVSTSGALSVEQVGLLGLAMHKLPDGGEVVAAVDADAGGDAIAEQLEAIFADVGRSAIRFRRHSPPALGQDWNDVLRSRPTTPPPEPR